MIEWRYLKGGQVRHALRKRFGFGSIFNDSLTDRSECGLIRYRWLGTGTQDEYENVEKLPECATCIRRINAKH